MDTVKIRSYASYTRAAFFFSLMVLSGTLLADGAFASWAGMTMAELVDGSDVVVVGEVIDVRPAPSSSGEGVDTDIGTVSVTEVLSGNMVGGEVMVLFPSERAKVRTSVDITYKAGQKGVWFLRKKPASAKGQAVSIYLADHPQRLMGIEHLETVRGFIKARRPGR